MSAWGQPIPSWLAKASTRPTRNTLTTLFWMGQVWETCQFLVFWTKSDVSDVRGHRPAGRVLVRRLREACERSSEAAQVLVEAHGELVLRLGKRPDQLEVALGRVDVRGGVPVVPRSSAGRGARSATAGMVLFGNGWPVRGSMIVVVKRPASWSGSAR